MEGYTQLLKGTNYGTYQVTNDHFVTMKDNKAMLAIPLNKISNSSVVNKFDVALELQTDEIGMDDVLSEIRFYLPSKIENKEEESGDKNGMDEEKGEDEEQADKPEAKAAADILNETIFSKANLTSKGGEVIVSFNELPFIVPRGKYSCDLSFDSMRMHGPTFNHIIQYKNVNRAFLLPKPDGAHMFFVLSLDKPVRQGNTPYQYLIMQIKKDIKETIKLKVAPEALENKLNEKLKEEYEGYLHDVIAKIFKSLMKINIIIPGDFKTTKEQSGVKTSVKAQEGFLFFLTKSLLFVPKPIIYIKLEDLRSVELHRLGTGNQSKMFDISLIMKNGTHVFSGIDKKDQEVIMEYFNNRKIPVKTVNDTLLPNEDFSDDDDEEEDRGPGKRRVKRQAVNPAELDDDEDEEDEDFIAGEDDDESDGEEDEDEDYEEEEKPKKASKKSK